MDRARKGGAGILWIQDGCRSEHMVDDLEYSRMLDQLSESFVGVEQPSMDFKFIELPQPPLAIFRQLISIQAVQAPLDVLCLLRRDDPLQHGISQPLQVLEMARNGR